MAITNKEINLGQLTQELNGRGLIADFNDPNNKIIQPANGSNLTEEELEMAISKHVPVDDLAIKLAQRQAILDRLGLTEEEAKLLLG